MDHDDNAMQRTPSQGSSASHSSAASGASSTTGPSRQGTARRRSRKQSSTYYARSDASDAEDKSLTSFPSLPPDGSPRTPVQRSIASLRDVLKNSPAPPGKDGRGLPSPPLKRATSRKDSQQQQQQPPTPVTVRRQHPSMVDSLTRHSPSFRAGGRQALFDDSPTFAHGAAGSHAGVPGNIHNADDAHIERLIARSGAVALVRQLAGDLALREMEMGATRRRAELRELELKKMLSEMGMSSLDTEKRLRKLDYSGVLRGQEGGSTTSGTTRGLGLGDLMQEALGEDMGDLAQADDPQATIRAANMSLGTSRRSSVGGESTKSKGWKAYLWSSGSKDAADQSAAGGETGGGVLADNASVTSKRRGIEENLFQPPEPAGEPGNSDEMTSAGSKRDRRSGSSSWTMNLFGGKAPQKIGTLSTTKNKSDASPKSSQRSPSQSSLKTTSSAQAALLKVKESNGPAHAPRKQPASLGLASHTGAKQGAPSSQSMPPLSPAPTLDPTNYGPVEMDSILPAGTRPPTLSPPIQKINNPMEPLTDRFGFIYDQRRRKKEAEALARTGNTKNRPLLEKLSTSKDSGPEPSLAESLPERPLSPASTNSRGDGRRWQDYLKIATFPTELLAHTPASSTSIMTLSSPEMQESLKRSTGVDESGAQTPTHAVPSTSAVTATIAEIVSPSGPIPVDRPDRASPPPSNDLEPVKLLLSQLTELHDTLQREREFKWNEFLRKVRAERRRAGEAALAEGRTSGTSSSAADTPEVVLTDGEMIGIATLGNKGKVGRAKYKEFKTLVLGGIPISYRAKIWTECSGASALRVPRYYDDLVAGTGGAASTASDPTVLAQIKVDIHRTLTDNVFFRSGPGVAKLDQVLRAYARRNPEVGYCQGMNLIAASLLLIMPTAEDSFWVLASIIEQMLPRHYFDHSLLSSRADQQVLRQYVRELLPKLSAHLDALAIDLEALTFQWFLSLFTACLSAEALYRVWDVLLCSKDEEGHGGSTFLFQVALALLKLNEPALLACEGPAEVYAYLGDSITNHAISIDGLIAASDGLRAMVLRHDVDQRRKRYVEKERETMRERERVRTGAGGSAAVRPRSSLDNAPEPMPVEG